MYVDHDYGPEEMKVVRESKIRFQTPFPAKFCVVYEGETRLYRSAAEATRKMVDRGFRVHIVKPAVDPLEELERRMWHSDNGTGKQESGGSFHSGI